MSQALLQTALLWPIEALLNRLVALDPVAVQRLNTLEGRTLAVQLVQPSFTLYVAVTAGRLQLKTHHEPPCSATLRGTAGALLALLVRRQTPDSLQGRGLELLGDLQFVRRLQETLLGLEIDWEYQLSRVVGDIPTQLLRDGIDHGRSYASHAAQRIGDDLRLFLHEESGLLPHRSELETFYDDVQALVMRLDRLEARLTHHTRPATPYVRDAHP